MTCSRQARSKIQEWAYVAFAAPGLKSDFQWMIDFALLEIISSCPMFGRLDSLLAGWRTIKNRFNGIHEGDNRRFFHALFESYRIQRN